MIAVPVAAAAAVPIGRASRDAVDRAAPAPIVIPDPAFAAAAGAPNSHLQRRTNAPSRATRLAPEAAEALRASAWE